MKYKDEIGRWVGEFESDGLHLQIYVNSEEWNRIPHFHLIDDNKKFEAFISLTKPKYISHHKKHGKLTKNQIHELIEKLNEKCDIGEDKPVSIYTLMCISWNINYNNIRKIPESENAPNYNLLERM